MPKRLSNQFKHPIIFQRHLETDNEIGDTVKTWVNVKSAWAMIKTVQGREFIQAASVQAERIVRFVIRYFPDITNDMRIVYNGRIFEITAPPINDDELNKTLTILGREVI
jgi:SPP1 family predicted phage head-tail adaptor